MEKIIQVQPGFDKRHKDPDKNYGVGAVTLRFILKGPLGATQFFCSTGMYPEHVQDEMWRRRDRDFNPFKPSGWDIGYHSPVPQYEGHEPMECDVLDGQCYYDGTSLGASEFMPTFLTGGEDAVWKMLQEQYDDMFSPAPEAPQD